MKILIRNSDNVVIYAEHALSLDATGVSGDDWHDFNFTSGNAHLADATPPTNWTGAAWSYVNGVWAVVDQARNDAVVAEAARRARPVPLEVTRRQGLQQLRFLDITEAMVEAKITEFIPDPLARDLALIEFRTSQVFERYRTLVVMMGAAFSLDLDEVFIAASKR